MLGFSQHTASEWGLVPINIIPQSPHIMPFKRLWPPSSHVCFLPLPVCVFCFLCSAILSPDLPSSVPLPFPMGYLPIFSPTRSKSKESRITWLRGSHQSRRLDVFGSRSARGSCRGLWVRDTISKTLRKPAGTLHAKHVNEAEIEMGSSFIGGVPRIEHA